MDLQALDFAISSKATDAIDVPDLTAQGSVILRAAGALRSRCFLLNGEFHICNVPSMIHESMMYVRIIPYPEIDAGAPTPLLLAAECGHAEDRVNWVLASNVFRFQLHMLQSLNPPQVCALLVTFRAAPGFFHSWASLLFLAVGTATVNFSLMSAWSNVNRLWWLWFDVTWCHDAVTMLIFSRLLRLRRRPFSFQPRWTHSLGCGREPVMPMSSHVHVIGSLDFNAIEARENAGGAGSMSQSASKCFKMSQTSNCPNLRLLFGHFRPFSTPISRVTLGLNPWMIVCIPSLWIWLCHV